MRVKFYSMWIESENDDGLNGHQWWNDELFRVRHNSVTWKIFCQLQDLPFSVINTKGFPYFSLM